MDRAPGHFLRALLRAVLWSWLAACAWMALLMVTGAHVA